jgi:hypothetical protein
MTTQEQQRLAEVLEAQLAQSNMWWAEGKSHAFIVGYLQGVIKETINELK